MKYKIKPKGKFWIVVNDKGKPCHKEPHKTEKAANKHCDALNAFFG